MASVDELTQEKQRIAERLARLDAERAKLADQLNELEIAERVLSRFGKSAASAAPARRGRPRVAASANAGPAASTARRKPRSTQPESGLSMSDAAIKAIEANGGGATAVEVLNYLAHELGMAVRPNHLGIALQRHRRAGRLENRDGHWYLPHSAHSEPVEPAMAG